MANDALESTEEENAVVVGSSPAREHAEAAAEANVASPEASIQDTNTTLASRPRRSLRSAGRSAEEKITKTTVKIINKRPQRKWSAERLLTDPKSPLAKANLRTILSNPLAWSSLDAEEHHEILALFPDQRHILAEEDGVPPRPNMESLMNDDSFRYDCAAYTENLGQGRHDPDWLAQAWAAYERRKAGDFKEFLRTKFENDWEVKLPLETQTESDEKQESDNERTILVGDAVAHIDAPKEEK